MKIHLSSLSICLQQWRVILAEFLATMFLIFFGCMTCIPIEGPAYFTIINGSFGFGLAAMFCIQSFGHISGSLMNPAVTIAVLIWEKIPVMLGLAYIIAECAGAILGYKLLMMITPGDIADEGVCVTVPHHVTKLQALGMEIMFSAVLSFVNCSVLDPVNSNNTDALPLKFGCTITALALAGSAFTGTGLNPVRSLGPAVWANRWEAHWVYWVGPLVGGIVPAIFYKYVWLQPKIKEGDFS